ncbi:MAG: hypothetical protein IT365_15710 [Candidatus Hydrogenedentes bacterium]|nr:hypothetical protein [Candidatus Hydrogenedentota bacterium]
MTIQAEVSLYPLRTEHLNPALERFLTGLEDHAVGMTRGPMSTHISGGTAEVFSALADAFSGVAEEYQAVLVLKLSNACPVEPEVS